MNEVTRARAAAAFFLGTLFFAYAFAQRVAPSVMTNELMRDFAVGGAALGSLSAFYFYAYVGVQVPVGMLMDRFGPRKLMSATLLLCALGSIGFAYSHSLTAASLSRFVLGGALGFGFVGTLTIASCWFPATRFALLSGILMTVGMIGAILGQAPLRVALENIGWRNTMLVLALIGAVLGVLIYLVVPRRSTPQLADPKTSNPLLGLKQVIGNFQGWMCAGIGFGSTGPLLAFSGLWAVPWLSSVKGYPLTQAAGIASIAYLGWAIGSPVYGWLSDRIGRRKPSMYFGLVLNIVSFTLLVFAAIESTVVMAVLFFMNGLGGCAMVITFGTVREHNTVKNSATALALLNMFVVSSGAVMQPLLGWVLDLNWTGEIINGARVYTEAAYTKAFLIILGASVTGLVCCAMLRETYCRPQDQS